METTEWNRILDWYSIEDGNCCNTGTRLTMKPLAGPRPRAAKRPAAPGSKLRKNSVSRAS